MQKDTESERKKKKLSSFKGNWTGITRLHTARVKFCCSEAEYQNFPSSSVRTEEA